MSKQSKLPKAEKSAAELSYKPRKGKIVSKAEDPPPKAKAAPPVSASVTPIRKRPGRPPSADKRPKADPNRKSEWVPAADHPEPVGRALRAAIKAFKDDKGALAEWIGVHRPNLSKALRECRMLEEGKEVKITWPPQHVLKLASVSGITPHELNPRYYEPQMKVKRYRPAFDADGKLLA